jgi:hypothetical protein
MIYHRSKMKKIILANGIKILANGIDLFAPVQTIQILRFGKNGRLLSFQTKVHLITAKATKRCYGHLFPHTTAAMGRGVRNKTSALQATPTAAPTGGKKRSQVSQAVLDDLSAQTLASEGNTPTPATPALRESPRRK